MHSKKQQRKSCKHFSFLFQESLSLQSFSNMKFFQNKTRRSFRLNSPRLCNSENALQTWRVCWKMVGGPGPLGMVPLIKPIYSLYSGYHWVYPLLRGSNRGVKQLQLGYYPKGTSIFPMTIEESCRLRLPSSLQECR